MNPKTLPQTNLMAEISQGVLQINNNMTFVIFDTYLPALNLTLATDVMLLPMQRLLKTKF